MSRSGYNDYGDDDEWAFVRWRGAVTSAIRGARGQAFLKEMLAALDALPERKLIQGALETSDGEVCAMGAVGKARNLDMSNIYAEDRVAVGDAFGIAPALAAEIAYMNDDWLYKGDPESRFAHVRKWVEEQIR